MLANVSKIRYRKPKFSSQKCINLNKTYSIGLYLPLTIKYKRKILINCDYIKFQNELNV